ncbi:hypothetical protein ACFWQC_01775 [Nocardioides sp. NPDC058538]|uniref:hypothetical protein n=1 Tax=Nocardioides sp. NPDC058538 TaxID=3346542 RepID=UPI00365921FC
MTQFFFPDNTALINFHILRRWDILKHLVTGKAAWVGSVASECSQSQNHGHMGMYDQAHSIFGEPIQPDGAEYVDICILRDQMAGPGDGLTQHLGEAETITVVSSRFHGSRFITDDAGAHRFATAAGITCYGTRDLLTVAVRRNLIPAAQKVAFEKVLSDNNRTIRNWFG